MQNCRPAVRVAVHLSVLLLFFAWNASPIPGTQTTYNFVGTCAASDCSGTASAQLVLANYTLGATIQTGNFVSLNYSSNLLSFTLLASDPNLYVGGTLPVNLSGPTSAYFEGSANKNLITYAQGRWCANCNLDQGPSYIWTLAGSGAPTSGAPTSSVPTMSAPALIGTGLILAAMGLFLLKRARRHVGA
jgi:hypothetical protein